MPSVTRDHDGAALDDLDDEPAPAAPARGPPLPDPRVAAVLVYGTLPPVRLQLRPWWAQGRGRSRLRPGRNL